MPFRISASPQAYLATSLTVGMEIPPRPPLSRNKLFTYTAIDLNVLRKNVIGESYTLVKKFSGETAPFP